jgi:hypothetical protein
MPLTVMLLLSPMWHGQVPSTQPAKTLDQRDLARNIHSLLDEMAERCSCHVRGI